MVELVSQMKVSAFEQQQLMGLNAQTLFGIG